MALALTRKHSDDLSKGCIAVAGYKVNGKPQLLRCVFVIVTCFLCFAQPQRVITIVFFADAFA